MLGTGLRFWNLDAKPLWLDEIVTALFGLGRSYGDVPVEVLFPVDRLPELFRFQAGRGCEAIAQTVAAQSTHPPLFFCAIHRWLELLQTWDLSLAWRLRSLSAICGAIAIVCTYILNRAAVSPAASLTGALVMALSPFGVYLSQEARQYALLLILVAIALASLLQLLKTPPSSLRVWLWLSWGATNVLGCYAHYFFAMAVVAQVAILAYYYRHLPDRLLALSGVTLGMSLSYLPWYPILIEHFTSPKISWLPDAELAAPLYQLLLGWLVMAIALPVEHQPLVLQLVSGLAMLAFGSWLGWNVWRGLRASWQEKNQRQAIAVLIAYIAIVLLEFLAVVYGLDKDITVAPRYNYVYFPAVCALIGIAFAAENRRRQLIIFAIACLLSCILVNLDLVFQKPYLPREVARQFASSPQALTVVSGYEDSLEIAIALAYALELAELRNASLATQIGFYSRSPSYDSLWERLAQTSVATDNLWVVAPGLRKVDFPPSISLGSRVCQRDLDNYYRLGIPYQRYPC